ncbi:hypothetical protein PMPD1_4389 (plasmid) [Paramixta manurensis]|uniref:Conjugal transfer protein TraS n=1 Tax=Paramixta manurensis TaxID=2740817 RepID=A0A6M8ULF1_9GAMM|nr:hypothetical protein PMPD1_4389 [Erwiniaceae bacterium PD-1]
MANFTKAEIDADMAILTDKLSSGDRVIPSSSDLLKKCFFIPVISVVLSFVSTMIFYLVDSQRYPDVYSEGFLKFLTSDGWVVVVPTAIIGLFFSLMTYNNLIAYLTIPENVRQSSLILSHLKRVVKRTITFFLVFMLLSTISSGFISWMAFGVPASELALFFIVNIVVGMEVNRIGSGLALEKISSLIKKI